MNPTVPPFPDSPYPGIAPFRFSDQVIFAGREREGSELFDLVTTYRGVLLYGASGTGKSSLIQAGLVPAALKADFVPARVRVQPREGEELIVTNFFEEESEAVTTLEFPFQNRIYGVNEFIDHLANYSKSDPRRLLLIFDQFEELIALFDTSGPEARNQTKSLQMHIIQGLVTLLQDPSYPTKLLFVFREDFLARFNILFEQEPDLVDQKLQILPLHANQLFEIIRAPFERLPGMYKELSPQLARAIVDQITKGNHDSIDLSALQIVCSILWESKDPEALFARTGIAGLLEEHLTDQFQYLPAHLRDAAIVLLSYMITPARTRNIISEPDLLTRAEAEEGINNQILMHTLSELVRGKIIHREVRNGIYFYEIASEFLISSVIHLRDERRNRKQLEAQHDESLKRLQMQRRRFMRMIIVTASFALIAMLTLFVASYTFNLRQKVAEREAMSARQQSEYESLQRAKNERIVRIVVSLVNEDLNAKMEALDQIEALRSEDPELAASLLKVASRDKDSKVATRALALLNQPEK